MPVTYCGNSFCYGNARSIESACRDLGLPPNKQVMFHVDGKYCYCLCGVWSGGQSDTPIAVQGWTQIPLSAVVEGQTKVLAAGRNLVFLEHVVARKSVSTAQNANNFTYVSYLLNGAQRSLVLPATRMLLLDDHRLVAAGLLKYGDRLTDHTSASVGITQLNTGSFTGSLTDVATSLTPPDKNLNGHLLLLNGVVAGDQMADAAPSSMVDALDGDDGLDRSTPNRPWIGSEAWYRSNGALHTEMNQPIEVDGGIFVPAALHAVRPPEWRSD
ncbi:MAG: hypothetical protein JNM76_18165 [Betaproteobacteria bacterium]|nr:hypothetical protein [Betaproteobacteria bacterium]